MLFTKRNTAIAGIAIVLVALACLVGARPQHSKVKMREPMIDKMMTVCVGRFLIDLPEGAQIEFAPARVAGVTIGVEDGYSAVRVKTDILQREQSLAKETNEYGRPSLEKKIDVNAVNFKATVLYYGREKPMPTIVLGERVPGTKERISVEALGLHADRSYRFVGKSLASPVNENNVVKLLAQFEAHDRNAVPSEAGFCTESGIIHDPIAPGDNESIAMFASLKGHPDVAIRLDSSVNFKEIQESLLSREAHNSIRNEFASSFTSLRKRARSVHGIDGEEVGDKVKESNGTSGHMFTWASMGKLREVTAPKITLELQTGLGRPGKPVNSSVDDDAVLRLWDAISSSIRIRPTTAGAKKLGSVAPTGLVPLGELAATGRICPQTGLWECNESGTVDGGRRQFFTQGDNMPAAVLRDAPSLWQKFTGEPPGHEVVTVWKLVDYLNSSPPDGHASGSSSLPTDQGSFDIGPDTGEV